MKPQLTKTPLNRVIGNTASLAVAAWALLLSGNSIAQTYAIDQLIIDKVYTFATPPGAQSAGGYLTITNNGAEGDSLIGVTSSFASVGQVHEMKMEDDIMKMRHLEAGLAIPAGETVELSPGGYHIMFMQLTHSLKDGETISASLTFSKAGKLSVDFQVIDRRKQKTENKMMQDHKKKDKTGNASHNMSHGMSKDGSITHESNSHGSNNDDATKE